MEMDIQIGRELKTREKVVKRKDDKERKINATEETQLTKEGGKSGRISGGEEGKEGRGGKK